MYKILNKPLWPFIIFILLFLGGIFAFINWIVSLLWISALRPVVIFAFYCIFCASLLRWLWVLFVNVPPSAVRLFEWDDGPWLSWKESPQTTMVINWITKAPTTTYIRWGSAPDSLKQTGEAQLTKIHRVMLAHLTPATKYFYQIVAVSPTAIDTTLHSFMTAPGNDDSRPFSFVLFGDTQNGGGYGDPQWGYLKLVDQIKNSQLEYDLMMHVGDASDQGNDIKSWHVFLSQSARMAANQPMHIAVGNHDTGSNYLHDPTIKKNRDDGANFDYLFGYPYRAPPTEQTLTSFRGRYYAFEYSCALFLFLDTQNQQLAAPWSPQWHFIEETLAKSTKLWKIVFVHWPMVEIKQSQYKPIRYAKYLLPILAKYGVQVIFTGHAHIFQHIEWPATQFLPATLEVTEIPLSLVIHQIISGGAGNELRKNPPQLASHISLPGFHISEDSTQYTFVQLDEEKISIEARYPDGKILYSTQIKRYIGA